MVRPKQTEKLRGCSSTVPLCETHGRYAAATSPSTRRVRSTSTSTPSSRHPRALARNAPPNAGVGGGRLIQRIVRHSTIGQRQRVQIGQHGNRRWAGKHAEETPSSCSSLLETNRTPHNRHEGPHKNAPRRCAPVLPRTIPRANRSTSGSLPRRA